VALQVALRHLLAFGTIALVVRHRRRQIHGHTDAGSSFLRESTNQGTHVTVTPFNPTMSHIPRQHRWQQGLRWISPNGCLSPPFSPGDSPLSLRRMISVPVGLSGKELARLRSSRLRSQSMDGQAIGPPFDSHDRQGCTCRCGGFAHISIRSSGTSIGKQLFKA
jgi:hypothetical protein